MRVHHLENRQRLEHHPRRQSGGSRAELHSSLQFLRPVDYYRGNPEAPLAERRRKLTQARELRKQENIKLRQRPIPFLKQRAITYSKKQTVSF